MNREINWWTGIFFLGTNGLEWDKCKVVTWRGRGQFPWSTHSQGWKKTPCWNLQRCHFYLLVKFLCIKPDDHFYEQNQDEENQVPVQKNEEKKWMQVIIFVLCTCWVIVLLKRICSSWFLNWGWSWSECPRRHKRHTLLWCSEKSFFFLLSIQINLRTYSACVQLFSDLEDSSSQEKVVIAERANFSLISLSERREAVKRTVFFRNNS